MTAFVQPLQVNACLQIELISKFERCNFAEAAVRLKSFLQKKGKIIFWANNEELFLVDEIFQEGMLPAFFEPSRLSAFSRIFLRTILYYYHPEIEFMENVLVKIGNLNALGVYPEFDEYLLYPSQVA